MANGEDHTVGCGLVGFRVDRLPVCCLPEVSIENNRHLGERMTSTNPAKRVAVIPKGMSAQ